MWFWDLFKKKRNILPDPVPTQIEVAQVENLMCQLQECTVLINSTTSPKTFFGRLNFALDILLELQKYEKYNLFSNSTPTKDFEIIVGNLEATVNDFIDRVIIEQSNKNEFIKSQSERDKRMRRCVETLWNSFYEAGDYWRGNGMYPHYSGKLFVDVNLQRVEDILHDLEMQRITQSVIPMQKTAAQSVQQLAPCRVSLYSSKRFLAYEQQCIVQFIEEDKDNADRFALFNKNLTLQSAQEHGCDLVGITNHSGGCCSECSKHSGRIYSISGKSKKYPKLPNYVKKHGNFHRGCWCSMHLYFEGSGIHFLGNDLTEDQAINRPYSDYRTTTQISWYEHRYDNKIIEAKEHAAKEFDREEYEAILSFLPDLAPKSFSAYRRMKKGNTAGFQKILKSIETVEE